MMYLSIYTIDNYLYKFDFEIINSIIFYYIKDYIYKSDKKKFIIYSIEPNIEKILEKNTIFKNLLKNSQYLILYYKKKIKKILYLFF